MTLPRYFSRDPVVRNPLIKVGDKVSIPTARAPQEEEAMCTN